MDLTQVVMSLSGPFSKMTSPTWRSLTLGEKGSEYQASQKPAVFHLPAEFNTSRQTQVTELSARLRAAVPQLTHGYPEKVKGGGGSRRRLFLCSLMWMIGDCQGRGRLEAEQEGSRCMLFFY